MQTLDAKQHVLLFEVGSHEPLAIPKLSTQQRGLQLPLPCSHLLSAGFPSTHQHTWFCIVLG